MQEEILQEAQLHAAVAEIADRTAYNALINHHLDNNTLPRSVAHSNMNKMATRSRKQNIINK